MAEARQMSLFGVDRASDEGDELDRMYSILLTNMRDWQPTTVKQRGLMASNREKFSTLTIQEILRAAGVRCLFKDSAALYKRLKAEGRLPGTEEDPS